MIHLDSPVIGPNIPFAFMKILLLLISLFFASCRSGSSAPVEIGTVKYRDSLKEALTESKTSGKPVFLLFQEVPG